MFFHNSYYKQWREVNFTLAITSAVLVILYTVTLIKVYVGSCYRFLILIIAILLGASLSYALSGFAICKLINLLDDPDIFKFRKDLSEMESWANVGFASQSFGFLLFSEAHWLLACFYFKIAKNMPRVLNGQVD